MPQTQFDRDSMAKWYAKQHLKTDPGIQAIYFLPKHAPEREIRFLMINDLIGERSDARLEPINFGVDTGMESEHRLFILDVTPAQWARIQKGSLPLPQDWTLEEGVLLQSR
jgi:hypothetical protein